MSQACHPQQQQGPAVSLNQRGLEDPIPVSGGSVGIETQIPYAFVWGNGLEVAYVNPALPDLASAQKHACVELCFVLDITPTKLSMHLHAYMKSLNPIDELRARGQQVRVVHLQIDLPAFGGSISRADRIIDMHPRERPPSNISTFDVPKFQQVVIPPPGLG